MIQKLAHPTPLDIRYHISAALNEAFPEGETTELAKARKAVRDGISAALAEHDRRNMK